MNDYNTSLLVYPYNYVDDNVIAVADEFFLGGFQGGRNRINGKPLDRWHIYRESVLSWTRTMDVDVDGVTYQCAVPKNLEEWTPIIDDLVGKGGWLVVMTHLRNRAAQEGHYYFDSTYIPPIQEFVKYAMSRGCVFMTAGEAFKVFQNQYEQGAVTDANHYIVDCNGEVYDTLE